MEETVLLPIQVVTHEIVYQDRNQSIRRVVADFGKFEKEYFVSDHGQRAALVVLHKNQVLLTRQYRLLPNTISLEIPGGRIDKNESPKKAAKRECLEETGVQCKKLKLLLSFHSGMDIWLNYTHVFLAEHSKHTAKTNNERSEWVSLDKCVKMAFSGEILDILTIVSIFAINTLRVMKR